MFMAQLTPRSRARRSPLERLLDQTTDGGGAPTEWASRCNPKDDFLFKPDPTSSERKNNFERYVTGYPWIYKAVGPDDTWSFHCSLCEKIATAGHLMSREHTHKAADVSRYASERLGGSMPKWLAEWNAPPITTSAYILFENADTLWPNARNLGCSTCRAPVLIDGNSLCLNCQARRIHGIRDMLRVVDSRTHAPPRIGPPNDKEAVLDMLLEKDTAPQQWATRTNPRERFIYKQDPSPAERQHNYELYVSGYPWIIRALDRDGTMTLFCALCNRHANIGHLLASEHNGKATMANPWISGRGGVGFPRWFFNWAAPSIVTLDHTLFGWYDELPVLQDTRLCGTCGFSLTLSRTEECVQCIMTAPGVVHGTVRLANATQAAKRREGGAPYPPPPAGTRPPGLSRGSGEAPPARPRLYTSDRRASSAKHCPGEMKITTSYGRDFDRYTHCQ